MATRLYLPVTPDDLAEALRTGSVRLPAETVAAPDESEDAEYEALLVAADVSAELVAGLPAGRRRRVVVVTESREDPVRLRDVVAIHADDADDADPDSDLGWYGTQELGDLVAGFTQA